MLRNGPPPRARLGVGLTQLGNRGSWGGALVNPGRRRQSRPAPPQPSRMLGRLSRLVQTPAAVGHGHTTPPSPCHPACSCSPYAPADEASRPPAPAPCPSVYYMVYHISGGLARERSSVRLGAKEVPSMSKGLSRGVAIDYAGGLEEPLTPPPGG